MRFRVSNIIRLWPRPCTLWSSTKSGALSKTAELIPVLEKIKENQLSQFESYRPEYLTAHGSVVDSLKNLKLKFKK